MAITPKWPVRQRASGGKRPTTWAMAGDAVTTAAHLRPARLKALLAETTLTATSAAPGRVEQRGERGAGQDQRRVDLVADDR